jgi:hypothetical protein
LNPLNANNAEYKDKAWGPPLHKEFNAFNEVHIEQSVKKDVKAEDKE